jgi:predicted nuclease of predicted toxin-antitoxin system
VVRLHDLFPESIHVRDVGLQAADDSAIWQFAQNNSLIVCSKDSDMHQRSFLLGFPPKVVWIRLGNCSTSDIERLLRYRHAELQTFADDEYASFLISRKPSSFSLRLCGLAILKKRFLWFLRYPPQKL